MASIAPRWRRSHEVMKFVSADGRSLFKQFDKSGVHDLTKALSTVIAGYECKGTVSNTYGSRHYNGSYQYSAAFLVGLPATHLEHTSVGGAYAAFATFINVAGIKTNANDVTAAFSGRVNATADQTLGDLRGCSLAVRNSAQTISGAGGLGLYEGFIYMGTGSATKTVRGVWIDILEQATTPDAARDWIVFGTQLEGGNAGSANITAFYANFLSGDLATQLGQRGIWIRGSMKLGLDFSDMVLVRSATPTTEYGAAQIVMIDIGGRPVSIFTYAGDPAGASTVGQHAEGSLCIDTTNKRLYINVGTAASPDWDYFSSLT